MRLTEARLGLDSVVVVLCAVQKEGASRAVRRFGWSGKQEMETRTVRKAIGAFCHI